MQPIPIVLSYTLRVLLEKNLYKEQVDEGYQFQHRIFEWGKRYGYHSNYLSCLNNFGAAQLDAQCARWKTINSISSSWNSLFWPTQWWHSWGVSTYILPRNPHPPCHHSLPSCVSHALRIGRSGAWRVRIASSAHNLDTHISYGFSTHWLPNSECLLHSQAEATKDGGSIEPD